MKITIWGDFACPFCYLGETQLLKVIDELNLSDKAQIGFRAYELNPDAPVIPTETMLRHYMSEHGSTSEEAESSMERITRMASRVGLDYNLNDVQVCNTFDAHRLLQYAQDVATQETVLKLNFRIYHANFVENLRISDAAVLVSIAEECGLQKEAVEELLAGDKYGDKVRAQEKEIDERADFELIPYMLFNDSTVLQGVLSTGAIKKVIV